MNPDLQQQQDAFKKTLKRQPEIIRHIVQRPVPAASPSPSLSSVSGPRPINSYVHSVISYLKSVDRPADIREVCQVLKIDPTAQGELLEKVCKNDRISRDGALLSYRPMFTIRTKEDILETLKERPHLAGLELSRLKEAYPKIEEMINELVREQRIYVVRVKEDSPKTLFLNPMTNVKGVDAEFKALWSRLPVPQDEYELRAALHNAGMKATSQTGKAALKAELAQPKKKASSRRRFPIKITNDYLEGIDLSQDIDTDK